MINSLLAECLEGGVVYLTLQLDDNSEFSFAFPSSDWTKVSAEIKSIHGVSLPAVKDGRFVEEINKETN